MSTTSKTNQPLIVVVSGGGPVGLTFSLHLTMMMGKNAKIIIYEGRWFIDRQGKTRWQGEEQGMMRRDQVITLQDHVIKQMPPYIQKGLFERINEYVWPLSRNIPIKEVEDRLFDLMQPFVQNGQVELMPENLHEQSECLINGNFDVLVGADGSNSFVRRYCNIPMINEAVEYACGIYYNIPDKVSSADEQPLHQALNCILSVSQTRYLLNSMRSHRGYLNTRLIKKEYDELRDHLQGLQLRNESFDISDTNKYPQTPVWTLIRQGLELFKIPLKYVCRVAPIEIRIRHASTVIRELHYEINQTENATNNHDEKKYKTVLVFLVGDAATNAHFWAGRGMNNGMKAAMALARNILRSCTLNKSIEICTPLQYLDFLDYESFIARLRAYEHQDRSLRVRIDPIDKYIGTSYSIANFGEDYEKYTSKLLTKLKETRKYLEEHSEWPHSSKPITDDELGAATKRILSEAFELLLLGNPWPTRETNAVEVLVEDIFPYDLANFSPVPPLSLIKTGRSPTLKIRNRFIVLWIIGQIQINIIDKLVDDIKNSPCYITTRKNKDTVYQLIVVQTAEEAKEWIKSNPELMRRSETRFRVITLWKINEDQTAMDVIRAVRSEAPHVPILIFTNKYGEAQPALEFPNVLATDEEYELKEFVGIFQETQWNPGYSVASSSALCNPNLPPPRGLSPLPYPLNNNPALPTLPNFEFPPICSPTVGKRDFLNSNSPNSASPKTPPKFVLPKVVPKVKLPPMILWIDKKDCDPKAIDEIVKTHPTLEISFLPTFHEAEQYLKEKLHVINERKKFIVISRGYYASESKNFIDVARMFEICAPGTVQLVVYTSSKTKLLQQAPNPPQGVEIFDARNDLIGFIRCQLTEEANF